MLSLHVEEFHHIYVYDLKKYKKRYFYQKEIFVNYMDNRLNK